MTRPILLFRLLRSPAEEFSRTLAGGVDALAEPAVRGMFFCGVSRQDFLLTGSMGLGPLTPLLFFGDAGRFGDLDFRLCGDEDPLLVLHGADTLRTESPDEQLEAAEDDGVWAAFCSIA